MIKSNIYNKLLFRDDEEKFVLHANSKIYKNVYIMILNDDNTTKNNQNLTPECNTSSSTLLD